MRHIDTSLLRRYQGPLLVAVALAIGATSGLGDGQARSATLLLGQLRTSNGGAPFAGDRADLVTISPNGDGLRDAARMSFRLARPARVNLQVLVEGGRAHPPRIILSTSRSLVAGVQHLTWAPPAKLEPRTYMLRLLVDGREAASVVVRVLGVEASFTRQSYQPGARASLVVSSDDRLLTLQLFQAGPEQWPSLYSGYGNDAMYGIPVTEPRLFNWSHHRSRPFAIRVRIPYGPSGLYFARLRGSGGRDGFAPFVLLPRRLGTHRIAVVIPTNTWQAYNHRDVDGDGTGDTWYAANSISRVDLTRPYLHHGVPTRFRGYELGFLRWLYSTGKRADFVSDRQLDSVDARRLHRLYDLLVFLGHHEYVTRSEYDAAAGYRDLGGNLMFTSSTNFLWRVQQHGRWLIRKGMWRSLGRPEAALIGVQYASNDGGKHQGHYRVVGAKAAPWAFVGTGLSNGGSFGHGGIEIDARSAASPPGTIVLATMPNLHGPGHSAEMTYYTTRAGAKVFAAGTLNFAGTALEPKISTLLENVWRRLSQP